MLKCRFAGLAGLSLLGLLNVSRGQAQGLGNSPYSRLGLGDASMNLGGVRQMAMGGVGLAAPNSLNVNELNPALIYYTNRTTYEVAVTGQFKTVRNQVASQRDGSGTLGYLAFAVPISKRWAAAAGLKPYSVVDYTSRTTGDVTGDPTSSVLKEFTGTGSLSEAYMTHAFRIAKGLSVGVTGSYVFGTTDRISTTTVVTSTTAQADAVSTVSTEHIRYSDFTVRGGLHYRSKINDNLNYNLAGVYSFQSNLNGLRDVSLQQQIYGSGLAVANTNTLLTSGEKGESHAPALTQLGVSFDNNKNWSVNFDAARQQWSQFRAFGEQGGTTGVLLSDTYRFGLGGEIVPDPTNVGSYFKRVAYRGGISVSQMPYRPAGQVLYDRAVSWGFALPVSLGTPLDATTVNLAFTYGQRGNTNVTSESPSGNVKEDYVRMQLGFSLNSRWFLKRRIE